MWSRWQPVGFNSKTTESNNVERWAQIQKGDEEKETRSTRSWWFHNCCLLVAAADVADDVAAGLLFYQIGIIAHSPNWILHDNSIMPSNGSRSDIRNTNQLFPYLLAYDENPILFPKEFSRRYVMIVS